MHLGGPGPRGTRHGRHSPFETRGRPGVRPCAADRGHTRGAKRCWSNGLRLGEGRPEVFHIITLW
eukprot:4446927-Lingulodinium_polyedra.AAC.1